MILGTVWAHPKIERFDLNKIAWTPTAELLLKISKLSLNWIYVVGRAKASDGGVLKRLHCVVLCGIALPRQFCSRHFSTSQQHQIQEPRLVHFAEVEFLRMVSNEGKDILLADTMDVVAISIMAPCALQTVLQPAVLDPLDNLVVILPRNTTQDRASYSRFAHAGKCLCVSVC